MHLIIFYVPISHLESVKTALFNAGAGRVGNYSHCAWQVLGQGQFMPLESSSPQIGEHHKMNYVEEYQVQMVCEEDYLEAVLKAFKKAHPYETPAYQVIAFST